MSEWMTAEEIKEVILPEIDDAFPQFEEDEYVLFWRFTEMKGEVLAELTETDIERISEMTEWWNGAEIESLVIRASQTAFRERAGKVRMEHFEKALKSMRIDIDDRKKTEQRYIELAKKMVNDTTFIKKVEQKAVSRMNYIGGR